MFKLGDHLDIGHYFLIFKLHEDILTFRLKMMSLQISMFLPAAELSGILHVFQWHISIRNIYLIITKLENEFDLYNHNNTAKSHEDIITYRLKTRSFKFDIFLS